jgi:hypothetical protein
MVLDLDATGRAEPQRLLARLRRDPCRVAD